MKRLLTIILLCALTSGAFASFFEVHVPMSGQQPAGVQRATLTTGHFSTVVHEIDACGHAYCPGQQQEASFAPSRPRRVEEDDHSDDPFMVPVGDTPWIFILLLCILYPLRRVFKPY